MEESTPSTLSLYILLQGSPGELRHSCRLDVAGNADDFPASKGRGETHGKGASLTTHTVLRVKSICSDPTSLCSHRVPMGGDGTDLEWRHLLSAFHYGVLTLPYTLTPMD